MSASLFRLVLRIKQVLFSPTVVPGVFLIVG